MKKHRTQQQMKEIFMPEADADRRGPKFDLMALGIELDDNLIERLQNNLGIETIFTVAQKSANLIKNKPHVPLGSVPEMIYRNVSENGRKLHTSAMRPFENSFPHTDNKFSVSVLKDLSNVESRIEGKNRPLLDKMIEGYSHRYMRSPERFVAALFGRPVKSTELLQGTNISKLVLKNRYVNADEFCSMIRRIDGNADIELALALFRLLAVDRKSGGSNASYSQRSVDTSIRRRNGDVLDLWEFLTLLKTSSIEARRGFDCHTSRLSNDVEFWQRSNFSLSLSSGTMQSDSRGDNVVDSNEKFQSERNKRINGMTSNTRRCYDSNPDKAHSTRGHLLTVAQLLNSNDINANSTTNKGLDGRDKTKKKASKSTLVLELQNKCDVPTALHSPLRNVPPSPLRSHLRTHANTATECCRTNSNVGMFGGSDVGDILASRYGTSTPSQRNTVSPDAVDAVDTITCQENSTVYSENQRTVSPSKALTRSASFLAKEFTNKTSVAAALGCDRPRRSVSANRSRQFTRSFMQDDGTQCHTARVNGISKTTESMLETDTAAGVMGYKQYPQNNTYIANNGTLVGRRSGSMNNLFVDSSNESTTAGTTSPHKNTRIW